LDAELAEDQRITKKQMKIHGVQEAN
jgi:hypothetical protein